MFEILYDVLLDAVLDSLKLLPFLFATYLFMEWLEHGAGQRFEGAVARAGRFGPVVGALLGVVPQCGFSGAAATLYAGRVVTLGTAIAVFLATSDEMLPIMISEAYDPAIIATVLAVKVAAGVCIGLALDALLVRRGRLHAGLGALARHEGHGHNDISELCEAEGCECDDGGAAAGREAAAGAGGGALAGDVADADDGARERGHAHEHEHAAADASGDAVVAAAASRGAAVDAAVAAAAAEEATRADSGAVVASAVRAAVEAAAGNAEGHVAEAHGHGHAHDHGHEHTHSSGLRGIFVPALRHTLNVIVFIFAITLALNLVFEAGLEGALASITDVPFLSAIVAGTVGLVPNCAVSVALTELYMGGVMGGGALVAGLCVNAGIGLLVLYRTNRDLRENLRVTLVLLASGIAVGLVVQATGIL